MSYTIDTVHVHGQPLSNAVPVDASAVRSKTIFDCDGHILKTVLVHYVNVAAIIRTSPQQAWINGPGYVLLNNFA